MSPERQQRIRNLFDSACERQPGERDAFVVEQCAGDAELARAVLKLLAARGRAGGLLDTPRAVADPVTAPGPGVVIGSYRVLRELGSGGMGVVYQVVRADELYHRVCALKILRPEYSGPLLVGRFRKEREILARLDHPNIARIVDGGSTIAGLPYFVMDYVDGRPINIFCAENTLTVVQRLALFRQICGAVQYLHDNRVIHGDLKPSNILVTTQGCAKILDFGISRVLGCESAERGPLSPVPLMTPGYASPEQLRGQAIAPSSDIYSLGILLFELLTGIRPYETQGRTSNELAARILATPCRKPSEAVSRSQGAYPPGHEDIQRRLRGELDSVVLKALHPDLSARYSSAAALAGDIGNHVTGMPVRAMRGSFLYRGRKLAVRKWRTVAVSAAFLALGTLDLFQAAELRKRNDTSQNRLDAVMTVQAQNLQHLEDRRKFLANAKKSVKGQPAAAELAALRQEQLLDVDRLSEAYRVSLSESVRLWPGMSAARRNLLDQADMYLHQAEAIASDDASREKLALAWLWLAKVEADPRVPNLHDRGSAGSSIREAARLLGDVSSVGAAQLMQNIKTMEHLIG